MKLLKTGVALLSAVLMASTVSVADHEVNLPEKTSVVKKAKKPVVDLVEPAFWWAGMKSGTVMLTVHGENIAAAKAAIEGEGISIKAVNSLDNPNYVFIDLDIKDAKAGSYPITFTEGKKKTVYNFELKARNSETKAQGLNQSDVMYLIMPDRFVNGNPDNDSQESLVQKADRSDRGGRHGGDIAGVTSKLDYLNDLGVTTVWLTPFLENNQPGWSYHGYAITDFYHADARHGSNAEYKNMVTQAHSKDMKVVMDLVFNHIGNGHLWMKDLPSEDWIHQWEEFTKTNYKGEALSDPNASDYDKKIMSNGWFDGHMPDLNQDNPYLAKYLMQASVWWIEYAGIDGIRMDTYPYNKKEMMSEWVSYVLNEYPDFYIVGETWLPGATWESYWKAGGKNNDGFVTTLKSISDFPVWDAVNRTWRNDWSITEIYKTLTEDFLYDDASQNKIFLDNHDVDRAFGVFKKDVENMKLATAFLLTTRGIPQIFYGTEILMSKGGDHGDLREDFPGGWEGDKRDAFTEAGRSEEENDYFNYMRTILQWRRSSDAIENGKLKHWVPFNEVYAYARYSDKQTVFVILNNNKEDQTFDVKRFEEVLKGKTSGKDIISGKTITFDDKMTIPAKTAYIIELK
ncbi:glycoside hydrolase family 13 protein [Flammeovirga sp. SubArs3]|uniref:glycoside hydrolase family 13 protein n=1 Tax=Flammeovirga sp. SubArs3 TaxID=2995316 RepID=UPI00248AC79C|nr:glycoside hydrolase family 13 protein [Flammeovirga sp. SubArs3]